MVSAIINKYITSQIKEVIGSCILFVVDEITTIRLDKEYNMELEDDEKRRNYESVWGMFQRYISKQFMFMKKNALAVRKNKHMLYSLSLEDENNFFEPK